MDCRMLAASFMAKVPDGLSYRLKNVKYLIFKSLFLLN